MEKLKLCKLGVVEGAGVTAAGLRLLGQGLPRLQQEPGAGLPVGAAGRGGGKGENGKGTKWEKQPKGAECRSGWWW